jgi:hypothetical protein
LICHATPMLTLCYAPASRRERGGAARRRDGGERAIILR